MPGLRLQKVSHLWRGSFDQLLAPNNGAFDLINAKSPIHPEGVGKGKGGVAFTIDWHIRGLELQEPK